MLFNTAWVWIIIYGDCMRDEWVRLTVCGSQQCKWNQEEEKKRRMDFFDSFWKSVQVEALACRTILCAVHEPYPISLLFCLMELRTSFVSKWDQLRIKPLLWPFWKGTGLLARVTVLVWLFWKIKCDAHAAIF